MKVCYIFLTCFFTGLALSVFAQCPPPGFPSPGNACANAPILCENLDGYCTTINNTNQVQTFPGCPGWQLNNDEWFGFFAGSTTITIEITPSNCSPGGQQGLQGAIYAGCGPPWITMDNQCTCTENPFILTSNNFVVGQVYYIVMDGCAGNVCDLSIEVLEGSTVSVPPDDPGPITGPAIACQGQSTNFSVDPINAATLYLWALDPITGGTITSNGPNATVTWGSTPGPVEICINPANLCDTNFTTSCMIVDVQPVPTATISGNGVLCANAQGSIDLLINFTGDPEWTFVYTVNGTAQTPITTSDNPYTLTITQPGTYALQSVTGVTGNCPGTVSGSVVITQTTITPTAAVTNAVCGNSNGAINLSVSGGNTPYMFEWSGGETTEDLSNIPPGSYTVTVTDEDGCTAELTVQVPDDPININLSGTVVNNTTCLPPGNGSITTTVSPAGNYTYEWSGGETTPNLTDLPAGSYTLTVTLGVNCTQSATFTIEDIPNEPMVTFTQVNTTCDLSNGSINVSVSGGVPPYTFMWGGGETTEDLSNIPAGTYDLTVTGANGCTGTANVTVDNNNPPFTVSANITPNTSCLPPTGNGAITLTVSPAGTYTYEWSGGETTPNLSNLPPGTYTVTVSAGGSCIEIAEFTVPDEPNEPNISYTVVESTCDLANGSINVTVSGGVTPYTYMWGGGETTPNLTNIPAGSYDLTVTGANGCTTSTNISVGNNNPPFTVDAVIIPNTSCLPPTGNGAITLNVSPGGSYTYEWSGGETTPNLSNLPPGTYTVTVSAGGSCIEVAEFEVPDEPNEPTINYTVVASTCDLPNGSINVTVSGGVTPYTYMWGGGETTPNLPNIVAGNYDLTVTGANGCTTSTSIIVDNNNPPISIDAVINPNTSCLPPTGNGSITLNISPGGAYTYMWSGGETTPNLSNLPPGTYTVTVSAGGSCTETAEFEVPDEPNEPSINYTVIESTCDLSNGSINVSVSGGVAPYTYMWGGGQTTPNLTNIPAGNYDLTVTGANGCTTSTSIIVDNNNPPISIDAVINPNTSCLPPGNGSITLNISPAGAYTYMWSGGQTTPNLNNLPPGTYTVTVSAGGSCTETAEFEVPDEPNEPSINFTTVETTCDLSNGTINVSVSGGVPPYTYLWSNGASTPSLNNIPAGSYSLTVTGSNGCSAIADIDLTNNNPPIDIGANIIANTACIGGTGTIILNVSPPGTYTYMWSNGATTPTITNLPTGIYEVTVNGGGSCIEIASFFVPEDLNIPDIDFFTIDPTCGQSNGFIDLTVFGGVPPYTYLWSSGQTTQDINNIPPGLYLVTVTGANGCFIESGVDLNNEDIPIVFFGDVTNQTSCVTNNGSITLDLDPPNLMISWSNASNQPFLNNLAPGTYTVTVSAGGTCTDTAEFTVEDAAEPPILLSTILPATCGFSNGSIDLEAYGGIEPYSYLWSNGATTQSLNSLAAGTYAVTVTTTVGCTAVLFNDVPSEPVIIEITGVASDNYSCMTPNGFIDIDLYPPGNYTFLWSNGKTTEDIDDLAAGTYTVSVTLGVGCNAVAAFDIYENTNPPNLSISSMPAICGQPNGSATVAANGGSSPYSYIWSNAGTTPTINNLTPGTYTVTVSGFFGCTATASVTVVNTNIAVNITGVTTPNTSCSAANGAINITATPAAPYTFSWSNMATTEDLSNVPAGSYTVTVSAGVGCSATASFAVTNNTSDPVISPAVTASICGLNNGAIDLTTSGGTMPYVFAWSNLATTEDLNNILAGNYTVTVTDANGCTADTTLNVPNNASTFSLTGTTVALTSCVAPNGSIDLTITPAGNYTFLWSNMATTEDIANLPAGTYTVSVTEQGDCTASASFVVSDGLLFPTLSQSITPELCGLADGAIDLSVSGGAMPFSYLWSGGQMTEDLSNIPMGGYTVTVTGANGCSATTSATVPENLINFSIAGLPVANSSCVTSNGSVDLTLTPTTPGAGPGYSFLWSNMATTEDIAGLTPGTYSVTVSAGGTCTNVASYNVGNTALPPTISENIGLALCGQSSGSINLTISGSGAPFTFLWSNMATTEDVSGLPQGNYTVTVTGANGCTGTKTFTILEDIVTPTISGVPTANTSCVASNGSINLSVSPNSLTYTFLWSTSANTQNISNLAAGSYTVTVNGGGSCTNTASFTVDNNTQAPVIADSISAALCGQNSGSINITISAGNSPFSYKWSNNATGEDLIGIASGTYTVTVTGASGCTSTASFMVPEDSVTPDVTATLTPNTSCAIDNGAINLSVTPVTLTYTYLWSGGQTTANISDLAPGTYTVTVYGGGACTNTASFIVENDTEAPVVADLITAALCGKSSGGIDLSVSSGMAPYTYLWSTNDISEDLVNIVSGTYSVTVTGANGCKTTANYIVPEDSLVPDITGTLVPNSSCVVDNGSISLSVAPTTLTYTYLWAGGQTTANLNNLPPGNYTVTVNGGGACTNSATFAVGDISGAPAVTGLPTDILCFGDNTGAIDLTITGGAMPYTIKWTPNIPGNPEDPTNLLAGAYSVVVTDTAGCATTANFTIKQPAAAVQLACTQSSNVTMPGSTDGAGTVTISGGVAPYAIVWSPGSSQTNLAAGPFPINNLGVGDYAVTVTDANGCTAICSFTISIINCETTLGVMQSNLLSLCGTGCQSANYNNIGQFLEPGDVLQFILHEGSGTQIINEIARSNLPEFCFDAALMSYGTTYYISAAAGNDDGTGNVLISHFCTVVSAGTPVVFQEKPVADATQPGPLNCAVSQVGITGSSSVPGSGFQWSTSTGQIIGAAGQAGIQAGAAGLYNLIVSSNGCSDTLDVTVLDLTNDPQAEILADPNGILDCQINQIILSGDIKGTTDANSVWLYNGNSYAIGTVLTIDAPGIYEFIIIDTLTFCTDTAQIEINENQGYPPLSITPPGALDCINSTVTLSGGSSVPGIQFSWALVNGTDTMIIGSGPTASVTTPGNYVLIGTDPVSHCVNSLGTQVSADQVYPMADAGAPFSIDCFGEIATLDGSASSGLPGFVFKWSTNDGFITSGSNTAMPVINKPGTYTLLVTNPGNGCTDIAEVVIDPDDPVATLKVNQPPCVGDKGSILVDTIIGGAPPIQYSINNGQTYTSQSFFTNLNPGSYTILVEDANGCATSATAIIDEPTVFEITLDPQILLQLGDTVQIQTTLSVPSDQIGMIQWTPADSLSCDTCLNTFAWPIRSTRYRITVISNLGCEDDAAVLLVVDRRPNVYIPNIFSPDGDGENDLFKIYADPKSVKRVKTFQVFSRWGELVYEYYNFDPNSPAYGWNGRHRGQELNPAVFVYYAVIEFIDGQEILYEGDVTLKR